jgi:hypothetical protein
MAATMRTAKFTYPLSVLAFSLGLLCSQVCGVICSFSNCSASAQVRSAAKIEQAGHCHQHKQPSRQEQPANDSQGCPGHDSTTSILSPETVSTTVSYHILQPDMAELISSLDVLLDLAGSDAYRGGHFRAPPRPPRFTVLRI